jgi:hypothetical protein
MWLQNLKLIKWTPTHIKGVMMDKGFPREIIHPLGHPEVIRVQRVQRHRDLGLV